MKRIKKEYIILIILLLIFILLSIFVNLGKLDNVDEAIYNFVANFKCDFLTRVLYVITQLASTIGIISLLFIFCVYFLLKKYYFSVKYLILNMLAGTIIVKVLKELFKRARPAWKWIVQGGFSYPSGHTISAMLLYGTLILIINKKVNNKFKKPLIIICSLIIVLTGLSRIYFGAHFFTDVLASMILGCIILLISSLFMNKEYGSNDKSKIKKTI
ncbi:MAG TPA: phosphatase PAP2 family protein [Candidatus Aphodocola excrementigallinarum]|uniref:Phosphatase PAP2 family protein n=1 Tax=Candidatus Aphodocola excrementigallinarum TaxID=2840670 RepID=A0A9D1IPG2_9FIRM|nr:phosphatase PAP2 family protein [Candidatus Aphodocola excrementigallinarum]